MPEAHPQISILTATRNAASVLPRALDSVREQSHPALEHVVIDGASTDGTPALLAARRDERLRWISEPDLGIADAFNKAVALAQGEALLFLGADDRLADPAVMADVAAALRALPRPWLLYGDCRYVYPGGEERMVRRSFTVEKFHRHNCLPHQALLVDRRLFAEYGSFDTSYRIAMDYEHLSRFVDHHPPVYLPRLIAEMSRGGVSSQAAEAQREMNRVRLGRGWTSPARAQVDVAIAALAGGVRRVLGKGW